MAALLECGEAFPASAVLTAYTGERILRLSPGALRRFYNDKLWRPLRGYAVVNGTWTFVGAGALAALFSAAMIGTWGVSPHATPAASRPSAGHSSSSYNWGGFRAPTTTTQPPTTTPPTTAPKRAAPPRASRSAPGPCDRPSNCPQLRQCENGGDYGTHSNNGFVGAYQIMPGTGRSVGMPANPTPAQQDAAADAIYARGGRSQWPVCGKYLR